MNFNRVWKVSVTHAMKLWENGISFFPVTPVLLYFPYKNLTLDVSDEHKVGRLEQMNV